MKVKFLPSDFIVEEVISIPFSDLPEWPYLLFKLEKSGYNTWYLLRMITDKVFGSRVEAREIFQIGGIKDKNAFSIQYVTLNYEKVPQRLKRNVERLKRRGFDIERKGRIGRLGFLGYVPHPMGSDKVLGNKFTITLRELGKEEVENLPELIDYTTRNGFPNYYDEQRFYHIYSREDFIARLILKKHFMGAIKLFFTRFQEDIGEVKRVDPAIVEKHWKDWDTLKHYFNGVVSNIILELLSESYKPESVLEMISSKVMDFHFMKYQSYVWNEFLNILFTRLNLSGPRIRVAGVDLLVPDNFPYPDLQLTLLHKKWLGEKLDTELRDDIFSARREVLRIEGIDDVSFNMKKYRGTHFKKFFRKVWVVPTIIDRGSYEKDDSFPGKYKYTFMFLLPPGSYATMMIKTIFARMKEA